MLAEIPSLAVLVSKARDMKNASLFAINKDMLKSKPYDWLDPELLMLWRSWKDTGTLVPTANKNSSKQGSTPCESEHHLMSKDKIDGKEAAPAGAVK